MGAKYRVELNQPEFDRQVAGFARRRMASLQRRIANQARQDVPVRTGNLGRRVKEGDIRTVGPRTVSGSVGDDARYAAAVHEGSRPHIIRPRSAKALRFNIGGRTVFATRVNHPGTRARPFLRNAGIRVAERER
ncbi:hypothetical protein H7K45_27705 [Mycobacterium yunnanensis]|uniref:Uncharacterized protein n=1 Tax=Mycobacterium yunnanensis TaxID=368477 RepID=A0A9X2Z7D7_9MYCO|nr:hypothetical protein [Mycobacterium yunnanensis]MCV7424338.1 hypothetical protein [Mycobacterium yunnanensis]